MNQLDPKYNCLVCNNDFDFRSLHRTIDGKDVCKHCYDVTADGLSCGTFCSEQALRFRDVMSSYTNALNEALLTVRKVSVVTGASLSDSLSELFFFLEMQAFHIRKAACALTYEEETRVLREYSRMISSSYDLPVLSEESGRDTERLRHKYHKEIRLGRSERAQI